MIGEIVIKGNLRFNDMVVFYIYVGIVGDSGCF